MQQMLYRLTPNRVRRNYRGGAMLAAWDGVGEPVDGECPEDWIASTVRARNPGLPPVHDEGLSSVETQDGPRLLTEVIADAPAFMLGEAHVGDIGQDVGFLTKLLDAGMRLHIQAHPTAAFARQHLGSRYGKMEAYLILGVREGAEGSLLLGFQHPPTAAEWRRIVLEQDKRAMLACFEPVPVRPGELWYVPGGIPHAIGAGLLVLEIMEPTDLVVRCEFEREGIVVPPEARFMGRDPDFALSIFDFTPLPLKEVRSRLCVQPEPLSDSATHRHDRLFGPAHSNCFEVQRLILRPGSHYAVDAGNRLMVGLTAAGDGGASVGGERLPAGKGGRFIAAAAAEQVRFEASDEGLELVLCMPAAVRA